MAYNAGGSSGNLVLIQKQTASNSASLTFTTGISGFDVYYLSYYNVQLQTNLQALLVQYSTDGGSTWVTTNYLTEGMQARAGVAIINMDTSLAGVALCNTANASASQVIAGNCYFYGIGNSTTEKYAFANTVCYTGGLGAYALGTTQTVTTAVNGFKVLAQSGNLVTGTFKLYGVAN